MGCVGVTWLRSAWLFFFKTTAYQKVTVETAAHTDCAAPSRRVSVCVHCVSGCGLSCGCVHTDHRSAGCTVGLFSGAGRPSHSAPTHQTRTTERCRHHALTPNKASRDTSLSLLSMPTTQTLAAQVSTPELSSEHGAFLLNCSNRCSFAHPASYFLGTYIPSHFFFKMNKRKNNLAKISHTRTHS